jgi:hypothetical protein
LLVTLLFFAALTSVDALAVTAKAAVSYTSGNWTYTVRNNKAKITAYSGDEAEVIIPSTLGDYAVTAIGDSVFKNNKTMTAVTIPVGIESIGYCSFYNCTNLKTINFNAKNCADRDTYNTFYNAGSESGAISVVFGSEVERIPGRLFKANDLSASPRIISVTMSDSITEIGECAFENCSSLKNVTWSSGLKSIGGYAFRNCTSLTAVTIPAGTEKIGYDIFDDCLSLSSIYYDAKNCSKSDYGTFFENAGKNSDALVVTFGPDVTKIPDKMFSSSAAENYPRITEVIVPANVTEIGKSAFENCRDLKKITIYNRTISFPEKDYYNPFGNCPTTLTVACYYGSTSAIYAKGKGYDLQYILTYTIRPLQ